MQTLHIRLAEIDGDCIELRYYFDRPSQYETQQLKISGIENLLKQAKRDYYLGRPALVDIGKQLFFWLDGNGRWLSRAIAKSKDGGLILAIDAGKKLAHLPWEVLHDDIDFLVKRVNPVTIPIRWIPQAGETPTNIEARPLRVLFMATSPQAVEPVLDFELEEARILEDTAELPLMLRVEESGCIEELGKLWKRYQEPFDVFHLTGHASIPTAAPFTPYFITETDTGEAYHATAAEMEKVFRHRWPQLIFLSGCRTGQAAENGAVPSMAAKLIELGAKAVLGWGRPVLETSATVAAAKLYGALAAGDELAAALADTYQYLIEENIPDWHLLRLYVGGECPLALVEPLGDAVWIPNEPIRQQFLDPATQKVRVATPEEFVGRRRTLQRCLKQLRTPSNLGVLLHGMGGVGKSTVTARLLERLIGYEMIFVYRGLDEYKLLRLLAEKCTSEKGQEILNGKLPLMQRLSLFLQQGLNYPEQRFAFVLDDFEANLELQNGMAVLQSEVVDVLMSLLKGITNSKLPHRVIITSRYDFALPELNHRLHREPLAALRGADLEKKYDRLDAFNSTSNVDGDLQAKAKRIADGNPRLLNWLDKILLAERVNNHLILQEMEKAEAEFRENILAAELLKQQTAGLVKMLGLALVYELPVPKEAIAAVCGNISNLDSHVERAGILGLLEISNPQAEFHYRVPRILESLLEFSTNSGDIYRKASEALIRLWCVPGNSLTEEHWLELHRLALQGRDRASAVTIAYSLATKWNHHSQWRETVKICKATIEIVENYRLFSVLSIAEANLGNVEQAIKHSQQSLALCPPADEGYKAVILYNLATIYVDQGKVQQAISFLNQCLEFSERFKDQNLKVSTLLSMARIKRDQGKVKEALFLLQRARKTKRIDTQSVAWTLFEMGRTYLVESQPKKAIKLFHKCLKYFEEIPDPQGQATALRDMAYIHSQQGQINTAIMLYQQSIEIFDRIGDLKGKAVTLADMSEIASENGQSDATINLLQQAIEIHKIISNNRDKIMALHKLIDINIRQAKLNKAIDYLEQILTLNYSFDNISSKVTTLIKLSDIYIQREQFNKADKYLKQALEYQENEGNLHLKANTLFLLGQSYVRQGKLEEALTLLQQSLNIIEISHDDNALLLKAKALQGIGIVKAGWGQTEESQKIFNEAINLYQKILKNIETRHNLEELALIFEELGDLKVRQGLIDDAIHFLSQFIEIQKRIGNVYKQPWALVKLGWLSATKEDFDRGLAYSQEALDILYQMGSPNTQRLQQQIADIKAAKLYNLAGERFKQSQIKDAISLLQQSLEIQRNSGTRQGLPRILSGLGQILITEGQFCSGLACLQEALDILQQSGSPEAEKVQAIIVDTQQIEAARLSNLAYSKLQQRQIDEAIDLFQQSLEIYRSIGSVEEQPFVLIWLGELFAVTGDFDRGLAYLQEALKILERLGSPKAKKVQRKIFLWKIVKYFWKNVTKIFAKV